MTKNNRGKRVCHAIEDQLPEGLYHEWLGYWHITQEELDVFLEAGEEAVNKMYKDSNEDEN